MSRSAVITGSVLVLILLLAGWFAWQAQRSTDISTVSVSPVEQALLAPAASSSFLSLEGNRVSFQEQIGTVIVAHSWATWVPTSDRTLQELSALQATYGEKVSVIAINRAESERTARLFLEQVSADNVTFLFDTNDAFFAGIEGKTMPETIIYSASGAVVHHKRGPISSAELSSYTAKALRAQNTQSE